MKKNKYTIAFSGLMLATIIATPYSAFAVNKNVAQTAKATAAEQKAALEQQKITLLKQRGTAEIDRRIAALTKLIVKIDGLKKLTTDQKSSLKEQINDNTTDLTALKTRIADQSDLTQLRADTKSITSSYRIFAVFMPKIHLLSTLEVENNMAAKLDALAVKLDTKIGELEAAGKNVADSKTTLEDMKAKISEANQLRVKTENEVIAIDPAGYPGNKADLQSARNSVITIKQSLIDARTDAVKIITDIKRLDTETSTTLNSNEAGQTNTQNQTGANN